MILEMCESFGIESIQIRFESLANSLAWVSKDSIILILLFFAETGIMAT